MRQKIDRLLDTTLVGYTRIGHAVRSQKWDELDEIDLTGRRMVVTGATSGIGLAAVKKLASMGADLVLVGRSAEKLERVVTELEGPGAFSTELADLSLMRETRALAERILLDAAPIHVLINNAGTLFTSRDVTDEGIEQTLATNLLSHYLLTELLMDRIVASAPSRIINVSSGGMYTERIRVRDLQWERNDEWNGSAAYARTKRGQVILTEMWADALEDTGVVVHSMHPGWADTPGVAKSLPTFRTIVGPFLRTPEQGADTIVWLAAAEEPTYSSGGFWHDRLRRPTHRMERTRETPEDRLILVEKLRDLAGLD